MVKFENPEVEAKFESLRENDGKVHIPAGKSKPGEKSVGYAGPLSKITLEAAEKALASGSNILKLREQAAAPAPAKGKVKAEEADPGKSN